VRARQTPAAGTYIPEPQPGDILGKLGYVREKEDPQTNYRCLPFPHGCEHMMHMCAIMQQHDFSALSNSTCVNFGLDMSLGFAHCREESFRESADEDPAARSQELSACLTAHLPKAQCPAVCLDLLRANVKAGEACEKSCTLLDGCISSCTTAATDPSAVTSCVGDCMGPVDALKEGEVEFHTPECNTTECKWLKMAADAADDTIWHLQEGLERTDHMAAATGPLYDLSKVGTEAPVSTTPFPWGELEKRLPGDFGQDPFAAFDPPTELPPSYQLVDPGEVVLAQRPPAQHAVQRAASLAQHAVQRVVQRMRRAR
jgi:hypothetical protein